MEFRGNSSPSETVLNLKYVVTHPDSTFICNPMFSSLNFSVSTVNCTFLDLRFIALSKSFASEVKNKHNLFGYYKRGIDVHFIQ